MIDRVGMGRKLSQAGLVAVMVLGGLMLWFGNPVLWLWIGSQLSENQRASMGPYAVVAIGIIVSTILVSLGMARVHRRYQEVSGHIPTVRVRLPWMRSMRGEEDSRPEVTVLDVVVVTTALLGLTGRAGVVPGRSRDRRCPRRDETRLAATSAVVLALLLGACGGGDDSGDGTGRYGERSHLGRSGATGGVLPRRSP